MAAAYAIVVPDKRSEAERRSGTHNPREWLLRELATPNLR